MDTRQPSLSPWRRRDQLPILPTPGALCAVALYFLIQMLSAQCGCFALFPAAVGGAVLAALLLLVRSWPVLLAPFGAAALALFTARDGVSLALSLLGIPLGVGVAVAVYAGMNRLAASFFAGALSGLAVALPLGTILIIRGISFGEAVSLLYTDWETAIGSLTLARPGGEPLSVFSPEAAATLVEILLSIAPALTAGVLFLCGYAVTSFVRRILLVLGAQSDFFADGWPFRADRMCAAVYLGAQALLLAAMTTPDAQAMYYALYNVTLFFLIPLSLFGLSDLIRFLSQPDRVGTATKAALAALALMLLTAGLYWLLTALALYGAYRTFRHTGET